ncbi:MAG: SufD family Fe-S cluster assembly protein [Oscillospiraceae bacterium]|nr:SufD family Fe-S cluster assembly protein [Oscillospiraceae bacterium]
MSELNSVDTALLEIIAGMKNGKADGAYNIRKDSGCADRVNTDNVKITTKEDKPGIDVTFAPGCKDTCHIPVIITESGLRETVYNDFFVGEGADVLIIAGCGIHNCGEDASEHDGVHTFHIGKNAKVKYVEKHFGEGDGLGENIMNPATVAYLEEGAVLQMETSQLAGIDSTRRETRVVCSEGAEVVVTERLLTHGKQHADSDMEIVLNGTGSRGRVISRSVAQDESVQVFRPRVVGNAKCFGHVQCDSIIMGNAKISSVPEIAANDIDAQLIHEAAIGRIAGDQLLKLETLGLTPEEAEDRILKGFLA